MRPVGAHRDGSVRAQRRYGEGLRAAEVERERKICGPGFLAEHDMQPAGTRRIARAGLEGLRGAADGQVRGSADAERVADAEHEARSAPLVAALAVLEAPARRDLHRALRAQPRAVKARLVDPTRFLADL